MSAPSLLLLLALAAVPPARDSGAAQCAAAAARRARSAPPGAAAADPGYAALDSAYGALRRRDYDAAIDCFGAASTFAPARTDVRKNLAYTYFRIGRNDLARAQFAEVVARDPADHEAALELAFLDDESPEIGARARAHALFARLRSAPEPDVRARADAAFLTIDRALAARIAALRGARRASADSPVLLRELAEALEARNELGEAESLYRRLLEVEPARQTVRLDIARVLVARGRVDEARAALRAAAAVNDPYVSEPARDALLRLGGA